MNLTDPSMSALWYTMVVLVVAFVGRVLLNLAEGVMGEMTAERAAALGGGGSALESVLRENRWVATTAAVKSILHSAEVASAAIVGAGIAGGIGTVLGVVSQIILATMAESTARRVGAGRSDQLALSVGVGLALIVRALPLWRLTKGVRTKPGATDGEVEVEELRNVVDTARVEAVIDREEHRIITAAMSLGELRIRDIMVPWVEVIEVPEAATVAEGVALMLQHRVSRAPIVTGEVVYVANLKDLLLRERSGEAEAPARSGARSCPVVPGTKSVARMMQEMQAEQQHLAAVADEYGKLCGIISLEDCLEELVGEIEDEHDRGDAGIVQSGAGVWFVPGAMTLRDLRKELGMSLDGGGTIGGFVFDQLGRSAVVGDVVESGGWRFEVTEMVRRRVVRIEMRRAARDEEA